MKGLMTLDCYLKHYGIIRHPVFRDRYTLVDRPGSICKHKRSEAKKWLKSEYRKYIVDIYSAYKFENQFDKDGNERPIRDALFFKENYPDYFDKIFVIIDNGEFAVLLPYDDSKFPDELKYELTMYSGMMLSPYTSIEDR